MSNYGDIRPLFGELAKYLKRIDRHTECMSCGITGTTPTAGINVANPGDISGPIVTSITANTTATTATTTAVNNLRTSLLTGLNATPQTTGSGVASIPAGYKSIAITKTNGTGTVNVTLSDGSVFPMTAQNELFADASSNYYQLPAYTIASADGGTWKWHGVR